MSTSSPPRGRSRARRSEFVKIDGILNLLKPSIEKKRSNVSNFMRLKCVCILFGVEKFDMLRYLWKQFNGRKTRIDVQRAAPMLHALKFLLFELNARANHTP